eukprot:gb/GECG01010512.1/.p1 GENE.gb/GECG01010512.1/~~gb/GECG01010512.1/.p1  ORF type:complete len:819 (+),score=104.70 gb/GECG01010512.1/:1-2457(+)
MASEREQGQEIGVGIGYSFAQLLKAAQNENSNIPQRDSQSSKGTVGDWHKVAQGMAKGTIKVGSRQPLRGSDAPLWATKRVVTGGFVTGELLAGGQLKPFEKELLDSLGYTEAQNARYNLNQFFLTESGMNVLGSLLESRKYRVDIPEEAALLTFVWLTRQGGETHAEQARQLLAEIAPWMHKFRFYPRPADTEAPTTEKISVETVKDVIGKLNSKRTPRDIVMQQDVIYRVNPLEDELLECLIKTLDPEKPRPYLVETNRENVKHVAEGTAWPLVVNIDESFQARLKKILDDIESLKHEIRNLRGQHRIPRRLLSGGKRGILNQLLPIARKIVKGNVISHNRRTMISELTGREVGQLRYFLAAVNTKRGFPPDDAYRHFRLRQKEKAGQSIETYSRILVARLKAFGFPDDDGIDFDATPGTKEGLLDEPVNEEEANEEGISDIANRCLPRTLCQKVLRCRKDTLENLVDRGLIGSAEALSSFAPALTANAIANCISDQIDPTGSLRKLASLAYSSFYRAHRSVLLLNYESQVRLNELPWWKAIEPFTNVGETSALKTLEHMVTIYLRFFPATIVPNRLLQQLRSLSSKAQLQHFPLVDELAADIFMGDFGPKFEEAAKIAVDYCKGTIYGRYYVLEEIDTSQFDTLTPPYLRAGPAVLGELCWNRGVPGQSSSWLVSPAVNGRVIEQEQVITTHNLAVFFSRLPELADRLGGLAALRRMSEICFEYVMKSTATGNVPYRILLHQKKNSAYAWRQMVFFLAVIEKLQKDAGTVADFLTWAEERAAQSEKVLSHLKVLREAYEGARGHTIDDCFLGWKS